MIECYWRGWPSAVALAFLFALLWHGITAVELVEIVGAAIGANLLIEWARYVIRHGG